VPGDNNTSAVEHYQHHLVLSAYPLDMTARPQIRSTTVTARAKWLHIAAEICSMAWTLLKPT
jgi:hypothetical protein